jgi:putative ABC transport system substrate-binding protein
MIGRREIITLLGGAAAWPLVARAQQPAMPVVGFVHGGSPDARRVAAFRKGLSETGYIEGQNVTVEYHLLDGHYDRLPSVVADLIRRVAVIATPGERLGALAAKAASTTIPIVFGVGTDPVKLGLVASLARPGGNATGFSGFDSARTDKFPELLKQIAPSLTRVAVIANPNPSRGGGNASLGAIEAAAAPLGIKVSPIDLRDVDAIERGVAAFAGAPNGGLIVPPAALATTHRDVIIKLAARYRLPAIYPLRLFVSDGGLMSYGPDTTDLYPRVAGYVDRILKGEKPGDLPVQFPTKFGSVINLRAARDLGLDVPSLLLTTADEVIE